MLVTQKESGILSNGIYKKNIRFQTTKEDKEQHGIGLMNVKKIVEKYNGIMEAYPKGSLFYVKLILYM